MDYINKDRTNSGRVHRVYSQACGESLSPSVLHLHKQIFELSKDLTRPNVERLGAIFDGILDLAKLSGPSGVESIPRSGADIRRQFLDGAHSVSAQMFAPDVQEFGEVAVCSLKQLLAIVQSLPGLEVDQILRQDPTYAGPSTSDAGQRAARDTDGISTADTARELCAVVLRAM